MPVEFWQETTFLIAVFHNTKISEAVTQGCSVKKLFLEMSQNSQENTCARVSLLMKLKASGLPLY